MLEISSKDNKHLKHLEKLNNNKKYRLESGEFVVENWAIISDALASGYKYESLFATPNFLKKQNISGDYFLVAEKLNKNYSVLDTPSGVAAVYKIKPQKLASGSVIYLNGISDPGNLGTILRSALAFGFKNLVLDETCVDLYNPKTISASKDAVFKLNIIEDKNGSWLKKNKLPLYATSSHLGKDLAKFKPAPEFCLVLGSESHGVSPEILDSATANLKIEISSEIESLNVASAAAILFYELRR